MQAIYVIFREGFVEGLRGSGQLVNLLRGILKVSKLTFQQVYFRVFFLFNATLNLFINIYTNSFSYSYSYLYIQIVRFSMAD